MPEHEEIGTRLTLDDAASSALEYVKKGFEGVKDRVHEAGHEIMAMAKQAVAFTIGFQLNSAIESTKEFGEELVHAAIGLENENKELAGVLAMVDKGDKSFEELSSSASELNDRLENLGITTGNSKATMIDAFEMIGERSTKGSEHVAEMVGKMAEASKTLPGGLATLSTAWRDLETGIVRPKNQLVTLMRQMDVVKGSSKDVAKALSAMVQHGQQDQVFKLAEEAVSRMAAKTKDMPLTFTQVLQGLSTFREGIFETAGTAIAGALKKPFTEVQQYLETHRKEIEELAHTLGTRVGEWVTRATQMLKEGFQYLHDHADEIMDALEKGGNAIKGAIGFVVAHKDLLLTLAALAAGNRVMGTVAAALPGIGSAAGQGIGGLMRGAGGAMAGLGTPGGMMAAAGGLAAGAAVVSVAAAAYQFHGLMEDTGLSFTSTAKHLAGIGGSIRTAEEATKNYAAALHKFNEVAASADATGDQLSELAQKVSRFGEAAVRAGEMTEAALLKMERQANQKAMDAHLADKQIQSMGQALQEGMVGGASAKAVLGNVVGAYRAIGAGHEAAADNYARTLLAGSRALIAALGAKDVDDAFARFKKLVADPTGKGGEGLKLPSINFGPNTFQIHQDFRGEDMDRVAVVFRRDINRQATDRIGSRLSTGFGF